MTQDLTTTPDGVRWLVTKKTNGETKRERIDPNLFPSPQPKPMEPDDFAH